MNSRTFLKELLYQLLVAVVTVIVYPLVFVVMMEQTNGFGEAYMFGLVFAAPVFLTLGVLLSTVIEQAKAHWLSEASSGGRYLVSLLLYVLAGAAAMYVYLTTILINLELHRGGDVVNFLAIGAGSAILMYHIGLALIYICRKISRAEM
jgi:hypothetical protein